MHELALAQNIIELLEEQAVNHQFQQGKASLAGDWRYGLC